MHWGSGDYLIKINDKLRLWGKISGIIDQGISFYILLSGMIMKQEVKKGKEQKPPCLPWVKTVCHLQADFCGLCRWSLDGGLPPVDSATAPESFRLQELYNHLYCSFFVLERSFLRRSQKSGFPPYFSEIELHLLPQKIHQPPGSRRVCIEQNKSWGKYNF